MSYRFYTQLLISVTWLCSCGPKSAVHKGQQVQKIHPARIAINSDSSGFPELENPSEYTIQDALTELGDDVFHRSVVAALLQEPQWAMSSPEQLIKDIQEKLVLRASGTPTNAIDVLVRLDKPEESIRLTNFIVAHYRNLMLDRRRQEMKDGIKRITNRLDTLQSEIATLGHKIRVQEASGVEIGTLVHLEKEYAALLNSMRSEGFGLSIPTMPVEIIDLAELE